MPRRRGRKSLIDGHTRLIWVSRTKSSIRCAWVKITYILRLRRFAFTMTFRYVGRIRIIICLRSPLWIRHWYLTLPNRAAISPPSNLENVHNQASVLFQYQLLLNDRTSIALRGQWDVLLPQCRANFQPLRKTQQIQVSTLFMFKVDTNAKLSNSYPHIFK